MTYYRRVGDVPPKRHTQHRAPDGAWYHEELISQEGFGLDSSLLYHRRVPAAIVGADVWHLPDQALTPNHPLVPRHLRLHDLAPAQTWLGDDAVGARHLVLGNDDVRIGYAVAGAPSPLYRNAIGDECAYVEAGSALVETSFGELTVGTGDYVIVPRGTIHRWLPTGDGPLRLYVIEAASHLAPPARYLSRHGQLLEHAPFCERDLHGPADVLLVDDGDTEVEVFTKHGGRGGVVGTRHVFAHHPFDVVGWDGCVYPYRFSIDDFAPITGRLHQPPPVHQVFAGRNVVVCNFVPRRVDDHPLAVPVPYFHANVDSDEVLFYCGGDYAARRGSGIGPGSVSLHPSGHTHGPQPGTAERSVGVEFFDELAVMVDTFAPLHLGPAAAAVDDPDYAWTWARGGG